MSCKLEPPDDFSFPFPPYEIQKDLMKNVFIALEEQKLAIFESPTGTGKSLSLICSALTWLHMHEEVQQSQLEKGLKEAEEAVRQCEASDDWFAAAGQRQAQTDAIHAIKEKLRLLSVERARVEAIKLRRKKAKEEESNNAFSRGLKFSHKAKEEPSHPGRTEQSKENLAPSPGDNLQDEELDLLLADDPDAEVEEHGMDDEEEGCLKIYYCSRTHSQLSQFVGELQRTQFGGAKTRVVALASRPHLCINPDVSRLKLPSLVNDRCLELQRGSKGRPTTVSSEVSPTKGRKRSKTAQACPFNRPQAVRALGDELLTQVRDLEEAVTEGRSSKTCPYYAARAALRDAQLVLVPYHNVLHPQTRAACGVRLQGNCLIVDEAHNLLSTLAAVQELSVSLAQVSHSRQLLQQYVQRYESRLSARNLLHVNQILFCLKAFSSGLDPSLKTTKLQSRAEVPAGQLMTVPQFLSLCRVENINLTALVRYLHTSKLSNKLQGFVRLFEGQVTINKRTPTTSVSSSSPAGGDTRSSTKGFLSQLTKDTKKAPKSELEPEEDPAVGASSSHTDLTSSTTGNPFLQIVELFQRLNTSHSSGRVLVNRDDALRPTLKYLVLDPASYFHDVVRQCRSVILVGGTMKPMEEFREELFLAAGAPQSRVLELSCSHVVSPDAVLPVALTGGPTGLPLDLTHPNRNSPQMVEEVGRVLYNLSCVVPAGVVVFLPSYQYSQHFLSLLRAKGYVQKISVKKKVLEEPREAGLVAALLADYTAAVRRAEAGGGGCTGAMLFCVVGGKMSEGINFSDALGRCVVVVGMPFPNLHGVELRERMKHLDLRESSSYSQASSQCERSAGARYYHNLCFRAVNQSIGRAIRHRNDFACMMLLDQRYSRPSSVAALPAWISSSLLVADKYATAHAAVAKFFARQKQRQEVVTT